MKIELTKAEAKRLYVVLNTFIKLKVPDAKLHTKLSKKLSDQLEKNIRGENEPS